MNTIKAMRRVDAFDQKTAESIWSQTEKHAGYSFNLSHAACYSVIAYWCGYMKVHHPVEFYAAILSATDDGDQRRSVSDDAARNSVEIVPPDVNGSAAALFLPARTGRRIVSPLSAIKGLGEKAADVIVGTREGLLDRQGLAKGEDRVQARGIVTFDPLTTKKAPFASLVDFQARVYARVVNKKIVENLCACGAMPGEQGDAKLMRELLGDTLQRKIEPPRVLKQEDILPIVAKINQLIDAVAPKAGVPPIRPVVGSKPRLMIVLDRPEWRDRDYGELGHGDGFEILRQLLKSELGLKRPDLYLTSFYRFYKPPLGDDSLDEVSEKILKIEIGNIEPSVILACGSRVVKLFSGGRGVNQMHGQLASFGQTPVVCCMSPTQAAIDSSKVADLKSALTDQLGALFAC